MLGYVPIGRPQEFAGGYQKIFALCRRLTLSLNSNSDAAEHIVLVARRRRFRILVIVDACSRTAPIALICAADSSATQWWRHAKEVR